MATIGKWTVAAILAACVLAAGAPRLAWAEDDPFLDMISPITDPTNFEDPRSQSDVRPIYAYHIIPKSFARETLNSIGAPPLNGGYVNVAAIQLRIAINDRWSIIATKDGTINVNFDDDAIRGLTVIKDGTITWPPPAPKIPAAPAAAKPAAAAAPAKKSGHGHGGGGEPASARSLAMIAIVGGALFWLVGAFAPATFLAHFTVFVLACFVGYMVIWNVTPSLHTPLMSVTNAISSIIAVGALIQVAPPLAAGVSDRPDRLILGLAVLALTLTAVNMFGGFAVTRRMLAMFRK